MEEVGVIVAGVTDDGYLRFACVGGIDRRVLFGKTVLIGKNSVFGVVGNKAVHLFKKEEREKIPPLEDMYIDIGASGREEALGLVSLGDTGVFGGDAALFGDGFIKARALDDRFGCAVLLKLLESPLPVDCTFVFTAQEEVGTRGALTASFGVAPDIALVVEGTTAADFPPSRGQKGLHRRQRRRHPVHGRRDRLRPRALRALTSAGREKRHPVADENVYLQRHGRRRVQRSRAGVGRRARRAGRNLHSPSCVAS
jgi:endoglucanase